jgi:6-phosphogluconolactonase (cycloisomerase 2 family)
MRRVVVWSVLLIASWLAVGCKSGTAGRTGGGGGGGQADHHDVLYVPSNSGGGEILAYLFDSTTGTLGAVNGTFTGPPVDVDIKVDTAGKFLYASDQAANSIYGFSIDPTSGALTPVAGSPFSFPETSITGGPLAIDPAGKFVFSGNAVGSIASFAINPTSGSLSLSSGPMTNSGLSPFYLLVSPSGNFLYASNHTDGGGQEIYVFAINSSGGILTQAPGSPFTFESNSQPAGLAMNTAGTFLYAALSNAGQVAGLSVDPTTSTLVSLAGSPYLAKFIPTSIALGANGQFLYAGNEGSGDISIYNVDPTSGVLIPNDTFTTNEPSVLAASSSGQYLFVVGRTSNQLSVYQITSSGSLVSISTTQLPSNSNVRQIAVYPLN